MKRIKEVTGGALYARKVMNILDWQVTEFWEDLLQEVEEMERLRFGPFSESIIKGALKKLHDAGIPYNSYEQARKAIGSDAQGYYILNTGTSAVVRLIELANTKMGRKISAPDKQRENLFECAVCGWQGKGTGHQGALIEGDRCPECGVRL